ncbi:MAG: hypothetical protein WCG44_03215 [bacterium]
MVNFTTTNIVGSASKLMWSQAQTVTHEENIQTMIVVQLVCTEEGSLIDLASQGMEILEEVEKNGSQGIDKIIAETKEGLEIGIIVGTVQNQKLTIKGVGKVAGYLARDGKLAKLGTDVSGELKEGDVVILATDKFVDAIGLSKYKEILTEADNPAELLTPLLHTQAETSGAAAVVGEVNKDKKVIKWPQINLRNDESPRKLNLWIGGAIFLLLIIMIGVGMVRRVKVVTERDYATLNSSINAKIEETLSVGDLNPERARTLLTQARGEIEAYLATDIRDEYKQKATKLIVEIESADERAFKKNDIKLTTVAELSILADNLTAEKMKSDGKGNLIFLDSGSRRVVSMNLTDRSRQVIDANEADQFVDVGVSEAKVYGLSSTGVTELFWKKPDLKKAIEPDEFWKSPTNIEIFAGNVYILDKEQGEIWKYPTLGDTFGDRRRWLAVGITLDLSNVVDMKVVGDIWLITSTGKLERYNRGAPVTFGMEGFPAKGDAKKLSEPSALWVTDSLVYVLENGASRVVVFGTDGKYQSQYMNSEFAKASDLVVVDDKAYVIIDNVVKEFTL